MDEVETAETTEAKPKKLYIIGTATNNKDAPYDEDAVFWATGGCTNNDEVKRKDAVFELHPERYWKRPEVLEILSKFPGTIYMQDHYEEIPTSKRYPIEQAKETFYVPTMGKSLYVTNTVSFMFMLAYLEGYKEIECYGVYMEHETEYVHQRLNCEYYIGWLVSRGVSVKMNGGEVLKAAFLYGYEEPELFVTLIEDSRGLQKGRDELADQLRQAQQRVWMQDGGIRYNMDLRKRFGGY